MCGIVAYVGSKQAYPIIIEGLKRLEYRGYDSAGIAILNGNIDVVKKKGKVSNLEAAAVNGLNGTLGMGHTRWATHGEPEDKNAHPHMSNNGKISLVHNGIIENYASIKKALENLGYIFHSDTDTEVVVNLIEEYKKRDNLSLEEAVRLALSKVTGAYAMVVFDEDEPDVMIGARKSSPLVLGIGDDEYFLASDASPIIKYTNKVVYLDDEEMVVVKRGEDFEVKTLENIKIDNPKVHEIDMKIEELEKGGYEHFMLKEIFQQPQTIRESMRGRISVEENWVHVGGMNDYFSRILLADKLIVVACGTSWHSALIGEYLFEDLARLPVEVEYASEFRYRDPIISEKDVVVALSQSGETADTLAALELAKDRGALIYGVVNVVGSSISRITHCGSYIHAGPEIGVASTKAFTGQVSVLTLMAMYLGYRRGTINENQYRKLIVALDSLPSKIERILKLNDKIKFIASEIKDSENALYLGRGYNFPVALEGALKLKEISYIHAEGYPAAEMKHGPIALIDENMPVIVIATNQSARDKIESNIQEIKARKGKVITVIVEGDESLKELSDYSIEIPQTEEQLTPLLSVIPLQLLSYHIAVMRGCNVDQPRNLAKSVTVE